MEMWLRQGLLKPLPKRAVLMWKVAQKVGAWGAPFRLGRGTGDRGLCALAGAPRGLPPADLSALGVRVLRAPHAQRPGPCLAQSRQPSATRPAARSGRCHCYVSGCIWAEGSGPLTRLLWQVPRGRCLMSQRARPLPPREWRWTWAPVCGQPGPPAPRLWRRKAGPSSPTSSPSAGEEAGQAAAMPGSGSVSLHGLSLGFVHSSELGPRCSSPVDVGPGDAQGGLSQGPERTRESEQL